MRRLKPMLLTAGILLWVVVNLFLLHLLNLSIISRNMEYTQSVENRFVHTVDLFDEIFQEISMREGIVEDLSEINRQFHSAQSFDFIEANCTTFYFDKDGYRGNPQFLLKTSPHTNPAVVALRGLFVGSHVQEHFDIVVDTGSYFTETDYLDPAEGDGISVVLGNAFQGYYQVGDSIDLLVNGHKRVGSVIGFLKKGSSILWFNSRILLDEFVLYPREMITEPAKNLEERKSMFRDLLNRNNGLVLPKQDLDSVRAEIDRICAEVGLPAYALSISYEESLEMSDRDFYLSVAFLAGFNLLTVTGVIFFLRRRKHGKKT